jgi:hypothetical protein
MIKSNSPRGSDGKAIENIKRNPTNNNVPYLIDPL